MKRKSFEEKVRSMSAEQIIRAMVRGLKKEHVRVDMNSFGHVEQKGRRKVCFGCAATNTVCEIAKTKFTPKNFKIHGSVFGKTARILDADENFVYYFETAIDHLRRGFIYGYNRIARELGIAEIKGEGRKLPVLFTDTYKEDLPAYERLAREQRQK